MQQNFIKTHDQGMIISNTLLQTSMNYSNLL